ncbi:lytic transglycosylase domain-containing protein [Streptomyces sp. NBC_00103]|uniref:lytic transglycosylase domain-containing protein n=1 Tax=Streptomyces sp. NBC_00103 TaxID=2975653 RepID=UPI00224FAA33|nr:lytic transglycosylase domain-containing protein [Streptomyces sp. NBC_00103]MCX5372141.1 lytic transglycosylase domain-containing protein [Streptomyces sp. NBC_00103]
MSGNAGDSGGGTGSEGMGTAVKAGAAVGGLGCLLSPVAMAVAISSVFVIGGFGVLFAPLIALILFFTGGGGGGDGAGEAPDPDRISEIIRGDGSGEFDPKSVPEGMADPIAEAGALCPDIGPVVIAAQIDQESGFQSDRTGPGGEQGVSQLPPDVFTRLGKDDDDNGETSALDAADSILAQGRFMCELADQMRPLVSAEPLSDLVSLTLAAYDAGPDAVREAGRVPRTNASQQYVLAIRAKFAIYQGAVPASPPAQDTEGQ